MGGYRSDTEKSIVDFMRSLNTCEVVDDMIFNEKGKRKVVDFLFLNRKFMGEMKSIRKECQGKVDNIIDNLKKRPEYPLFYGEWPLQNVLNNNNG